MLMAVLLIGVFLYAKVLGTEDVLEAASADERHDSEEQPARGAHRASRSPAQTATRLLYRATSGW